MKPNFFIRTAGIWCLLAVFCGCSGDLAEEITHTGTEPSLVFQMSKGDELAQSKNESIVKQYSSYLFYRNELIQEKTSEYQATGIRDITVPIPEGYKGERLKAMVVVNDRVAVSEGMLLEEFTQQAITRVSPANFATNGLPMAGEVEFEVGAPDPTNKMEIKRACSTFYVKLTEGSEGDLGEFSFIVAGIQRKGGFLFQDGAIPGAALDHQIDRGTLSGKQLQPLCYFYPTNEEIQIMIIPDPIKYLGVPPVMVKLPREKALLKNQRHVLKILPPTPVSSLKVSITPWSEESVGDVDVSAAFDTTLKDLNVNIGGNNTLKLQQEGTDIYSLVAGWHVISSLRFSLPEGATISPNPNTLLGGGYKQQEFKVTSELGKVGTFKVKYYPDKFYTLVVLGDTEYGFRGYSYDQALTDVNKIAMVKEAGNRYFKDHPRIKIDPELLMIVGDVSGDRDNDWSRFESTFANCYRVGIKCMNIYGNHDWDPEFWEFSNGTPDYNDPGFTYNGRKSCQASKDRIKEAAKKSGIGITDFAGDKGETPFPYYFTYRGVRYYCGNSFWFMPGFESGPLFFGTSKLYNSDKIIRDVEALLNREGNNYPAIWMHHYPFRAGDRWWGGYDRDGDYVGPNTAEGRMRKMKELIGKTKNPTAFAGHVHYAAVDNYTDPASGKTFTEYVTPYFRDNNGSGYFVLVSEKEGVLAVQEFQNL